MIVQQPLRTGPASRSSTAGNAGTSSWGNVADDAAVLGAEEGAVSALTARAPSPDDEALEEQREAFDFIASTQAEFERETNALRAMAIEQMKHDDELLKKWIELI